MDTDHLPPLAFLDTETTGLDPDLHEIWEVGLILRTEGQQTEYVWQLPVDLGRADPIALNIGHFHDRRWPEPHALDNRRKAQAGDWGDSNLSRVRLDPEHMQKWCEDFADLTRGAHLVGNVVSFDEERLRRLLRRHGQCPMWHYHLVDVEALAVGYLAGQASEKGVYDVRTFLPWNSETLSEALGVIPPSDEARHTALGDAQWAMAIYDTVTGDVRK